MTISYKRRKLNLKALKAVIQTAFPGLRFIMIPNPWKQEKQDPRWCYLINTIGVESGTLQEMELKYEDLLETNESAVQALQCIDVRWK